MNRNSFLVKQIFYNALVGTVLSNKPSVEPHFFIVDAEAPRGVCLADEGAPRGVKFELSRTCDLGLSTPPIVRLLDGLLNGRDGRMLFCAKK